MNYAEARDAHIAAAAAQDGWSRVPRPGARPNPDRIISAGLARRMGIAGRLIRGAIRVTNSPALDHFHGAKERRQNREKLQ